MAKLTNNQKLWLETTTNILTRINKLKSKGYDTSDLPKPPKRPEIITNKQLLKLKKVEETVEAFEKLTYEDPDVIKKRTKKYQQNEIKARNRVEQIEIRTGYRSVVWDVFAGIENAIEQAQIRGAGKGTNLLKNFVDLLKETYGSITTASIFYNAAQQGINITSDILYDSDGDKATQYISHITNFIRDKEDWDTFKETIIKLFEAYDTLESSEIYED